MILHSVLHSHINTLICMKLKKDKNFTLINEIYVTQEQILKIRKINGDIIKQRKLVYYCLFLFVKIQSELETLLCGKCWRAETIDLKIAFYFSRFLQIVKYLNFTLKTRLTLVDKSSEILMIKKKFKKLKKNKKVVKSRDTFIKNIIC